MKKHAYQTPLAELQLATRADLLTLSEGDSNEISADFNDFNF